MSAAKSTSRNSSQKNITAVFFDVGGVCVHSPLLAVTKCETKYGLPENYLNVAIQEAGGKQGVGSWQQLERGELTIAEFTPAFDHDINHSRDIVNRKYVEYCKNRKLPIPSKSQLDKWASIKVPSEKLFHDMMFEAHTLQKETIFLIKNLNELRQTNAEFRARKLQVNALTNNFKPREQDELSHDKEAKKDANVSKFDDPLLPATAIKILFDNYIESSIIGLRKPEPKIYEVARKISGPSAPSAGNVDLMEVAAGRVDDVRKYRTKRKPRILGISAKFVPRRKRKQQILQTSYPGFFDCRPHSECLLVDDLGVNLKSAQKLGWSTVRIPIGGDIEPAIRDVAYLLKVDHLIDWNQLKSFDPAAYLKSQIEVSKFLKSNL